jgi:hypothetical protein
MPDQNKKPPGTPKGKQMTALLLLLLLLPG